MVVSVSFSAFYKKRLSLIFLLSIVITLNSLAEEITLNVGESKEISGNDLKLKGLKSDKAVITVNEKSQIVDIGDEEDIGALKVRLIEIFYVGDNEGNAKLEVTSIYTCGDGKCEGTETKSNCCKDCGCNTGYDCIDNECKLHVEHGCNKDEECNDNNSRTSDRCTGYPRQCVNAEIEICDDDSDCDDNNECTTDSCRNNDCFNEEIEGCTIDTRNRQEKELEDMINKFIGDDKEKAGEIEEENSSLFSRIISFFKKLFRSE